MSIEETREDIEQKAEDYLEKQLERVNGWLSFAEAKNAGLIAANVALLAVIIALFNDAPVFCVIAGVVALGSCALSFISFLPISKSEELIWKSKEFDPEKDYNLIFYNDIAEICNLDTYMKLVNEKYFDGAASFSNKAKDLAFEVMENCKITMNKYKWFKLALKVDLVALACVAILLIAA